MVFIMILWKLCKKYIKIFFQILKLVTLWGVLSEVFQGLQILFSHITAETKAASRFNVLKIFLC